MPKLKRTIACHEPWPGFWESRDAVRGARAAGIERLPAVFEYLAWCVCTRSRDGLNGSTQQSARAQLASKAIAKIARKG